MKLSKTIFMFLFTGSILAAFYYGLRRTNGNVYQSILFTFYFISVKLGLLTGNQYQPDQQDQPNQQVVMKVQSQPIYTPYVSLLEQHQPSSLRINSIEKQPSQPYLLSNSRSVIHEIRAGDLNMTQVAWLFITI